MRKIKYGLSIAGAVLALAVLTAAVTSDFKLGRNMQILADMFREISVFYVDETDPDDLLAGAAAGMTMQLDPYSEFIPESEIEEFEIMTTGKYGGIGSLIRKRGDYIAIAQPYKNSPADRAGLKIGDRIVEIEGQDAKGFDASKVSSMLKGDPGTFVTLKVRRLSGEVDEVTIKRERISMPGIPYYGFIADGVGYIRHDEFTENCSDDMLNAIMEMKNSGDLKGLVLDYRGNGGGILQEAVKILSFFVPKGTEVVSMRGRTEQVNNVFITKSDPVEPDLPIVVLAGSGSASAAEIVTGAIQDLDRGVVIGQRTFGKGLVQSTRPLGYNAYLKLTTAKYYIPSGRCIQAVDYTHRNEDGSVGLIPDSLINEFSTRNGRRVYDGGGIMPDIRIAPEYASRFAMIVYALGYTDDFVDEWVMKNSLPQDAVGFTLSNKDYAWFVEFMEDKSVEYESETKRALAELRRKAEQERYLDRIEGELELIAGAIKDDKQSNLMLFGDDIRELIENEIILRSSYAEGVIRRNAIKSGEVTAAVELLHDAPRYEAILASQDTERK